MQRFVAQMKMTYFVQIEFELPDFCNQSTIEIQAKIEAEEKFGEADEFEILDIQTKET